MGCHCEWWITTNLSDGGHNVMGPFCTRELALRVREHVERSLSREDLWVEFVSAES